MRSQTVRSHRRYELAALSGSPERPQGLLDPRKSDSSSPFFATSEVADRSGIGAPRPFSAEDWHFLGVAQRIFEAPACASPVKPWTKIETVGITAELADAPGSEGKG
jgi:hypothetical protein